MRRVREPGAEKKQSRLRRDMQLLGQMRREPRTILSVLRGWFVGLWRARGAGFYGLGYAVTFVIQEARSLTGDFGESEGIADFLTTQVIGYIVRVSFESVLNALLAFLWPIDVILRFGAWGIAILGAAFLAFEIVLRPVIESWFPELRSTRDEEEPASRP
jgi:hypothetical protein